jgi:hypothetical protein
VTRLFGGGRDPPQARTMVRVISPDEYDSAARLYPALCPLVAAGDARCGRRLLSEAGADVARGFTLASEACGGGGGGGGGDGEPANRLVLAARAVAQRLRRLATISAAAACSAVPEVGQNRAKAEPGGCASAAGMAKEAGAHTAVRNAGARSYT